LKPITDDEYTVLSGKEFQELITRTGKKFDDDCIGVARIKNWGRPEMDK